MLVVNPFHFGFRQAYFERKGREIVHGLYATWKSSSCHARNVLANLKSCLMDEHGWHLCSGTRPLRRQLVHRQPWNSPTADLWACSVAPVLKLAPASSPSSIAAFGLCEHSKSARWFPAGRCPCRPTMLLFFFLYNYITATSSVRSKSKKNGVLGALPSSLANHCDRLSPASPAFYPNHPQTWNRPISLRRYCWQCRRNPSFGNIWLLPWRHGV